MEGITIRTAQNVDVRYEVASFGDRLVAYLIDVLIMVAWVIALVLAQQVDSRLMDEPILFMVVVMLPFFFYHLACEILMNGQSVGKRARRIKVARLNGDQATVGQYLLRWLLRPVDSFYFIGVITIFVNGKGQRLGDLVAGTTVVSMKQRRTLAEIVTADALDGHAVRYARAHLLSDAQAQLIRDVLRRTDPSRPDAVLAELADKVRAVIGADREQPDREFLATVLRDHAHLTAQ